MELGPALLIPPLAPQPSSCFFFRILIKVNNFVCTIFLRQEDLESMTPADALGRIAAHELYELDDILTTSSTPSKNLALKVEHEPRKKKVVKEDSSDDEDNEQEKEEEASEDEDTVGIAIKCGAPTPPPPMCFMAKGGIKKKKEDP